MYGATKGAAETLVPLARSWLLAPKAAVEAGNVEARTDLTQRCYVLSPKGTGEEIEDIGLRLEAKPESPTVNPAFVVEDWGKRDIRLKVNGQEIKRGKDFRFGHVRRVNRYDLIVWVRLESDRPVEIELMPAE
jgi:hypothetical protein